MNMMHTIDPDMVVFGGGMIAAGEPLPGARSAITSTSWRFPVPAEKTQIRYAQLGSDAGLHRRGGVCEVSGEGEALNGQFMRHRT